MRPPLAAAIGQQSGGFDSRGKPATLADALAIARRGLEEIESNVHDYSAVLVKQERIGDEMVEKAMFAKIREKPFSVYLCFLAPPGVKGREVIYVAGRNNGDLLVHTPGPIASRLGTLSLDPHGMLAMYGEHHPITDIGLANLCRQLIQRGEAVKDPRRVRVVMYSHARINDRQCSLAEITYPVNEPDAVAYLARVFVDKQWHFPIRVEVYRLRRDRDPQAGAALELVECYTYIELTLNRGYTDADFSVNDPQYKFR